MPAAIYIETHGGTGTGGSDDHAGVDIGRTFTETPPSATPEEFLRHVREGRAEARGEQGSAAKWAHAAMALSTRALFSRTRAPAAALMEARCRAAEDCEMTDPDAVLKMAERVMSEGNVRKGRSPATSAPKTPAPSSTPSSTRSACEMRGRALVDLHAGRRVQPCRAGPPRPPRP